MLLYIGYYQRKNESVCSINIKNKKKDDNMINFEPFKATDAFSMQNFNEKLGGIPSCR